MAGDTAGEQLLSLFFPSSSLFCLSSSFSSPLPPFACHLSSCRLGISVSKSNKSLVAFLEPSQREKDKERSAEVPMPTEWMKETFHGGYVYRVCSSIGKRFKITGLRIAFVLFVLSPFFLYWFRRFLHGVNHLSLSKTSKRLDSLQDI